MDNLNLRQGYTNCLICKSTFISYRDCLVELTRRAVSTSFNFIAFCKTATGKIGCTLGMRNSSRRPSFDVNGEVNFDHFQIFRAIGRGSFGKVCIIQKKDTKEMFAMKYMNKTACIKKKSVGNVLSEVELLKNMEHPFLVNLWFAFQDEEDMFIVVDLLLGGDLRYHMQQDVTFSEACVEMYICEIALALEYLRQQRIVHRDIKPDNILLDEEGHVHITDFNVAVQVGDGELLTSTSGTKPYMAPEIFICSLNEGVSGYSFPVDWWSLGVCAYELLRGKRPYDIKSGMSLNDTLTTFANVSVHYPSTWQDGTTDLLKMLLSINPQSRISSVSQLKSHPHLAAVDLDRVLSKSIKPPFVPPKDHLNCDPTYELEEMIIEAKPLHRKKKKVPTATLR